MDIEPDPEEAARRLRAAIAYVGIGQEEAAKAIGVSVPTLARMIGRKGVEVRPASWGQLWKFADMVGLPRAWFTADIARIHQIVPDDLPSFPNDIGSFRALRPSAGQPGAAMQREEEALRKEAERSRARQQAERSTKRGRRRRQDEGP